MLASRRLLENNGALISFKRAVSSFSNTPINKALLQDELRTRLLPLSYDYLSPQPSHLLNLSLLEILHPEKDVKEQQKKLPSVKRPLSMPPGHHLVYFPPQVTLSELLPDGTDILHTPGEPFNRRLWAGGKVIFPSSRNDNGDLLLNGNRAVCVENIDNVDIKGPEGDEKILVTIDRRFALVQEDEEEALSRLKVTKDDTDSLIEKRTLVFMRDRNPEDHRAVQYQKRRVIKAPTNPDASLNVTPTKALLFRFSALTFNAHLIHLDQTYAQNTERHHDLLVHGPLTLVLMLTFLSNHLAQLGLCLKEFEYRNLVPLHVNEKLRICVKAKKQHSHAPGFWEVWIEGPEGGLAVRGTAWTVVKGN